MLDSIYFPLPEDIDDPAISALWSSAIQADWTKTHEALYHGFADETCLAAHPGADAYLCGFSSHVQLNHITTPFVTRQDLTDPVVYQYFSAMDATMAQYATWTRKSLERVPDVKANAEERAKITLAPGVYASNCGQHIVLLNGPWLGVSAGTNATVQNADGTPLTMHDALTSWATGTPIVALDTPASTTSVCVATTQDQ
jgi:hypothetical protein